MEKIYFREGVYILINSDNKQTDCICDYWSNNPVTLWGGRVEIYNNYSPLRLEIDGISIIKFNKGFQMYDLSYPEVVSHLNAMETNGVDAFLLNYKLSIEFLYDELKNIHQEATERLSSTQEEKRIKSILSELETIRESLLSVLSILFQLKVYMSAGLENEMVISVCQSIMDSLA